MNKSLSIIKLFFLAWQLVSAAFGDKPDSSVVVESMVDKSEITIGDKLNYQIKVSFPPEGHVELPSVLGNLGAFEVKDYKVSEPVIEKGSTIQIWDFILSTFTVGEYTLPPQIVDYFPKNDTAKWTTYSEPINITVNRTTAETVKDIADITDIIPMPAGSKLWLWIVLALLALITFGIILYWEKIKPKDSRTPRRLPPYEEATEALSQLVKLELPAQGKHKEFCFQLSEIIRRFLSRRFSVDALESTTEEFLKLLAKISITAAHREILKEFCEITDPVKFAHQPLEKSAADKILGQIRDVIEQNKPRSEELKQTGSENKPEGN